MGKIKRIVCPLCMHNFEERDVRRKGRFLMFNPNEHSFIYIEEIGGKISGTGAGRGKAKGRIEVIEGITLEEAKKDGSYDDIIISIKKQIIKIVNEFIKLGIIKKGDIKI